VTLVDNGASGRFVWVISPGFQTGTKQTGLKGPSFSPGLNMHQVQRPRYVVQPGCSWWRTFGPGSSYEPGLRVSTAAVGWTAFLCRGKETSRFSAATDFQGVLCYSFNSNAYIIQETKNIVMNM
jgi:hypothetical protein